MSKIILIFISITSCFGAFAEIPGDHMAGEEVKQEIVSWLSAFRSLQCTFKYLLTTQLGQWKQEEVKYRWQDDMQYYEAITLGRDNSEGGEPIGALMMESLIKGKGTLLGHQNDRITGEVNRDGFHFGYSTRQIRHLLLRISPEEINTSPPLEIGLHSILSCPGVATILEEGGERVLVYWPEGETLNHIGANIYLAHDNSITRIDYVKRPECTPEEVQLWTKKDFYKVFNWISSVELTNYQPVEGLLFPFSIRETYYRATNSSVKRFIPLAQQANLGEISRCEFSVKMLEGLEYESAKSSDEITILEGSVKINRGMQESDFEIEIPPDTGIVDIKTQEVFRTAQETWLERHADLVIILVALGILGGATVAGWRYWLGKP